MKISLYSNEECQRIAEEASLKYVRDNRPGIIRKVKGKKFSYHFPDGSKITSEKDLKRIEAIGIPPVYTEVWICPYANGHIQATAKDSKLRKQYYYHPLWCVARQLQKFQNMLQFGRSIFFIRDHVNKILKTPFRLHKQQIICAIIYLLDNNCLRIGNSVYAKENKTYGLTTLRKKHLSLSKNRAILDFEGKNSKTWHIILKDKKIVNILKKCEEIPGYELFKYQDEKDLINVVTSQDVNAYLKAITRSALTAKDFRTWIASRETFCRVLELISKKQSKGSIKDQKAVIKEVAELLGHTPAVCKKNYIFPQIFTCWENGKLEKWKRHQEKKVKTLSADEKFFRWLKNTVKKEHG